MPIVFELQAWNKTLHQQTEKYFFTLKNQDAVPLVVN